MPVVPVALQPPVGVQSVGSHRAPWFDRVADEAVQGGLGHVRDSAQPHPPNARAVCLAATMIRAFASVSRPTTPASLPPSTSRPPRRRPAAGPAGPDHGASELVEQGPGRPVAAQPQNRWSPQGAHPGLLVGDVPHGAEPRGQGEVAILEERARGHRRLVATGRAQPAAPGHRPGLLGATVGANKSLRPAELEEVLSACIFTGEAPFQFHERSR